MNHLALMWVCKQKLELQSCNRGGSVREAWAKADMWLQGRKACFGTVGKIVQGL